MSRFKSVFGDDPTDPDPDLTDFAGDFADADEPDFPADVRSEWFEPERHESGKREGEPIKRIDR